jgi:hypothetical protein
MNLISNQRYTTRVRQQVAVPKITGVTLAGSRWTPGARETYLGAFGLAALSEIGIWTKLLHSAGLPSRILMIDEDPKNGLSAKLRTSFAPSRLQDIVLIDDPNGEWRAFVEPDCPERAFAMHVRGPLADPLMLGLPTEQAWDLFQDLARQ